jgi:mRNA interferase MazF
MESDSLALAEQVRTIDRSRLDSYIGNVGKKLMPEIDTALAICMGIDRRQPTTKN